jgi:DnaJ-class molecular chaperone
MKFDSEKKNFESKASTPKTSTESADPKIKESLIGLGLSPKLNPTDKSDAKIIRAKYKKLARLFHPNMSKNVGDKNASQKFQEIASFYQYLESKNPQLYAAKKKRGTYKKKYKSKTKPKSKKSFKKRKSKKRKSKKRK